MALGSIGGVCTRADPPAHARVGDLWHPRGESLDEASFCARLREPGGGCRVLDEAGDWVSLIDQNVGLVGKWGRDKAAEIDARIDVAEAQLHLARGMMGIVVHAFARELAVNPYVDKEGAFRSATHALLELTAAIDDVEEVGDDGRLARVLVLAEADWVRLEQGHNGQAAQVGAMGLLLGRDVEAVKGDMAGLRDWFADRQATTSNEIGALRGKVNELILETHRPSRPPVPEDAAPALKVALVLNHRPVNRKALAAVLHMSRTTITAITKSGYEAASDFGQHAVRPTEGTIDALSKSKGWDMNAVPKWCRVAIENLEKRSSRQRRGKGRSSRKEPYVKTVHRVHSG